MTPERKHELRLEMLHWSDAKLRDYIMPPIHPAFEEAVKLAKDELEKRQDVLDKIRDDCQNNPGSWDW